MREIKFRAWDKTKNVMLSISPYQWEKRSTVEGAEVEAFDNEFDTSKDGYADRKTGKSVFLTLDGQLVNVSPLTEASTHSVNWSDRYDLMQFTGLKDKNGKEIYEGDVVEFILPNEHEGETEYIEEITYEGSSFVLDGNVPVDAFEKELEVIGNIYENPELLK